VDDVDAAALARQGRTTRRTPRRKPSVDRASTAQTVEQTGLHTDGTRARYGCPDKVSVDRDGRYSRVITAIRATSRTLADYLQAQLELDPDLSTLFSPPGTMRVYLNTPAEMTGSRAGLSVWLYRVVRDDQTLNRPPVRVSPTQTKPAPLPLRLHYLLAPMTGTTQNDAPETEQAILGKALQALHDHPSITGIDLSDDFAGTETVITSRFEPLTIDELARIWDALDTSYRTSVSFEVTVVELDSGTLLETGPPVRIPVLDTGIEVG
jgi:hypothetical protein